MTTSAGSSMPMSGGAPTMAQIQKISGGPTHMPWPANHPAINVPSFDNRTYTRVNLNAAPSEHPGGLDLPLNDMTTLRFFFNLGVQQARVVLIAQHFAQMSDQSTLQQQKQHQQTLPNRKASAKP